MYFVDFEASSLGPGGYPIEIGWCSAQGWGTSHLIRPHPDWLATGSWDASQQAVHGISMNHLLKHGKPIDFVAACAVRALDLQHVFSEDPESDNGLMEDLLYFGGCPEMFHLLPVQQSYEDTCRSLLDCATVARERSYAAQECRLFISESEQQEREEARPRVHHRAFEGALANWRTWRRVFQKVEVWL